MSLVVSLNPIMQINVIKSRVIKTGTYFIEHFLSIPTFVTGVTTVSCVSHYLFGKSHISFNNKKKGVTI